MLKKNLLVIATLAGAGLLVASTANAALPGFYVGGQAGWADMNYSKTSGITDGATSLDTDGVAGRLFAGYQFDQNWAAEFGYTKFSNVKAKFDYPYFTGTQTLKEHAFDLVAKGILPLQNGFNMYGKLGAALISMDPSGSATVDGVTASGTGDTQNKVYPTFGVGVSYDITPNVPVDISWNRIQKTGGGNIQSTNFFSAGIAYNFG